ncbi:MAG: hypothetical protein OXP12_09565 [Thaumarchaeota archaeon]|nr:hypothetical protein [Nitrososphaerota archaeon]MDE0526103.1 hypothetical protein [Nitrososphaerota archaeon]
MDSIGAYRKEIRMQVPYVQGYDPSVMRPIPDGALDGAIFAGCGDSLAAAMLAEYFSGWRSKAADPSELAEGLAHASLSPESKIPYLISVSGETAANVRAAEACRNAVAVTANPDSRLAALASGRVVPLDFPRTGVSTAGSISFTSSVLACLSLVNPGALRQLARHARPVFERAESDAARIRIRGSLYVLGGAMTYPLAMYAAAKFYEVLGYDARHVRTEQFSHMEVFSAHEGDTVMLFEEPRRRISDLVGSLGEAGLHAFCVSPSDSVAAAAGGCGGADDADDSDSGGTGDRSPCAEASRVLYYAFLSQLLTLRIADEAGVAECHYVSATRLRGASNAAIY